VSFETRLNRAWYGRPGLLYLLLPLEWLFRLIALLRRLLLQPEHSAAAVLVVGNISVGGSGKTPVVLALAEHCKGLGYQVGIVSRGYGGQAPQYPYFVDANSAPEHGGDEPCLMARRSGLPVAVDANRHAAVKFLQDQHGCNLIISDDGLQHYRMARDIEILVVDGQRGFGNGHCLPVGPLREPLSRAAEIDLRIINGSDECGLGGYLMQLSGKVLVNLNTGEQRQLSDWPKAQQRCHAIAGIGNPQRFFSALVAADFDVIEHAFPDHHPYRSADLDFDDNLPVLMTEKDAVKCAEFATANCWMLPVDGEIDASFYSELQRRLAAL
jgi:tetraacyldisaccharide 4'-kinase